MIARFRISEDDYVAAMKLFARVGPRRWLVLALMAIVFVLGLLFGGDVLRPASLLGFCIIGGILVLTALAPRRARRHYRQYKAMQEEFGAELLEDGLRLESPHGTTTIVWANMRQWRQSDRFVLVYLMPRLFHILPKSVADQGFDLSGFIERLNRRIGPEA